MSLAPASSRGAFLKARLAVNGIQCAARSLGTLTAAGRGLLPSIGASFKVLGYRGFSRKLSASLQYGNAATCTISSGLHYFRSLGRLKGAQRDIEGIDEPVRIIGHFDRAVQLLAKRLDQLGSETSPGRRLDRGPPFSVQK